MTIRVLLTVAMAAMSAQGIVLPAAAGAKMEVAQAADPAAEKEAFEAAKELGTLEAWDAFLSNYSTGFRADLARAYVKKLGDATPAPAAAAPLPVTPAATAPLPLMRPSIGQLELATSRREAAQLSPAARTNCSERAYMKSSAVNSQARITFINYGAQPYDVYWIDENGQQQLYGEIKKDRQATVDTFTGHPWMLTDLSGNCLTIAIPNPGPQVFVMGADAPIQRPAVTSTSSDCGKGRIRIDGNCVRKSQAADFCGPGYRPEGGRCVQGYQAPKKQKAKANTGGGGGHPWETPRCRAIMAQCNNGANPSACQQHELSCTYQD